MKCPALFILGRRDVMTPPQRRARLLQEKIAGAKTVEIGASGHTLMAEAPDATLDALIAFYFLNGAEVDRRGAESALRPLQGSCRPAPALQPP